MGNSQTRANSPSAEPSLLSACELSKDFAGFMANDRVSLDLKAGEIHALLGENGAGKSTFVKMLYGSLQPTGGQFRWRGRPVNIKNPRTARAIGIGMVFQHFSLFDGLSVVENVALAIATEKNLEILATRIASISKVYGLALEPHALVADLSVGERQRVEIVRCLLQSPKLLIMDEPTAVLTPQEAGQLFITLRRLANEGCAILYISHRLQEVRELCDQATIMRQGQVVAAVDPKQQSTKSLARLMVGDDVNRVEKVAQITPGEVVLSVNSLTLASDNPFGVTLSAIDLVVRQCEIVAIAGIAGNGQSEFFAALSGESPLPRDDMLVINGRACGTTDILYRRSLDAAFIPEERLGHGAVPEFSLSDNVILTRHSTEKHLQKCTGIDRVIAESLSEQIVSHFGVRTSSSNPAAHSLSGGNLQKFVVGRELDRKPTLVVVNQPTWGVDAGAAELIRQSLTNLAHGGTAVLMISQDLDEIFEIATRVAVLSRGYLSESRHVDDTSFEEIGLIMGGENLSDHNAGEPV